MSVSGTLFVVATPIGNLEDITFRALRVLKEADLIACEDTRHTRNLFEHFGFHRPTVSLHDHNEADRTPDLIERLAAGQNIAVVSDAGTPLIEDPGYRLVLTALENGILVVPIPGASSLLTALTASGLPTSNFYFGGFLPHKSTKRKKMLESLRGLAATLVFFETPHRILESLEDIQAVFGNRQVVLGRELTKLHEEFLRGTAEVVRTTLAARPAVKGEMTLLIGKAEDHAAEAPESIEEAVDELIAGGLDRMEAIKAVARRAGLPKRAVYRCYGERREGA